MVCKITGFSRSRRKYWYLRLESHFSSLPISIHPLPLSSDLIGAIHLHCKEFGAVFSFLRNAIWESEDEWGNWYGKNRRCFERNVNRVPTRSGKSAKVREYFRGSAKNNFWKKSGKSRWRKFSSMLFFNCNKKIIFTQKCV